MFEFRTPVYYPGFNLGSQVPKWGQGGPQGNPAGAVQPTPSPVVAQMMAGQVSPWGPLVGCINLQALMPGGYGFVSSVNLPWPNQWAEAYQAAYQQIPGLVKMPNQQAVF